MRLLFAPLHGITTPVFRSVWHDFFGGEDALFIPFISPTPQHILTPRDQRELQPNGLNQVPQVMAKYPDDFLWAAGVLAGLGYTEVNLNLGCPSGTVTAKCKGAGLLLDPNALDRFLDRIFSHAKLPVSIKTRIGFHSPDEFPNLLRIFNQYPVHSLIIHPRTRDEKYLGPIHPDAFQLAYQESKNPICYNGDITSLQDLQDLQKSFPDLDTVMIGRGAVADPALFRRIHGGPPASIPELQNFTASLYSAYQQFYGQPQPAAQRMKEVWFYLIHLFQDGERLGGKLRRSRGPKAYEELEAQIFQSLDLLPVPSGLLA